MRPLSILAALCVASTALTIQAFADPVGEWRIADGSANVSIRPCGNSLCGFVSWSQEGEAVVGKQVLISMHPAGALWAGTAVNVRDGQKYTAHMSMQDEQTLKLEGCVMGGMICGGQQWARVH